MGRRATLPRAGYRRPDMLSADGLVVAVVGEDGRDNGTYDFTNAPGAGQLKLELVAVFARLASSAGTWTTVKPVVAVNERVGPIDRDDHSRGQHADRECRHGPGRSA